MKSDKPIKVPDEKQDLFIRRLYRHNGISVVVDIDLERKEITLMDREGKRYTPKRWVFAERGREYLGGWVKILEAMKHAIVQADGVLQEADERDQEHFLDLLMEVQNAKLKKEKP